MVKKIEPVSNWIPASDAAQLLTNKMGFLVEARYIRQLAKSKKQPIETRSLGYHQLYRKDDVLSVIVKRKSSAE